MASIFITSVTVIIISISCHSEQGHLLHYKNYLQNTGLQYWENDKEELGRRVDKIPGRHQIELAPTFQQEYLKNGINEWLKHVKEGRAVVLDRKKDNELHVIRRSLLEKKLKVNNVQLKRTNDRPEIKTKLNSKRNVILNREVSPIKDKTFRIEAERQQSQSNTRLKRDLLINLQVQPGVLVQPHIRSPVQPQADKKSTPSDLLSFHFYNPSIYYPEVIESLSNRTEPYQERVKGERDKRQVVFLINKYPQKFLKGPRTTPNPFIREANIDEYDIVKPDPDLYKPEPDVVGDMDTDSYMISETSDLEYESEYTISMSDSEDWENFPLTTPLCPNPAWHLSTLADIYQKPKRKKPLTLTGSKIYSKIWLGQEAQPMMRMKRSPKQKKRRIGARKEKLKQRRKIKEMKRKMRIIKESKEDKTRKVKEEGAIEDMLHKPKPLGRSNSYKIKDSSEDILWSNDTHRIVEDKGASFKWINKTHYIIFKDNVTNKWYSKHHVLVYGGTYLENKTYEQKSEGKNKKQDTVKEGYSENYSEDYDEEFTKEEEGERRQLVDKNRKDTNNKRVSKNIDTEKKKKYIEKKDDNSDGKMKGKSKDMKKKYSGSKINTKIEEIETDVGNDTIIDDGLGWEDQIEENEDS